MIKFKALKFKHYREAQAINRLIDAGEAVDEDVFRFAVSLIEEWDFVDVETGQAIPLREIDELSLKQCAEINSAFAGAMGVAGDAVPKVSDAPSSSI